MVNCIQLRRGETRKFTRGHVTRKRIRVTLDPGEALVINRGFNHTTFVKCGKRIVTSTRIVSLKLGQTVVVKCEKSHI